MADFLHGYRRNRPATNTGMVGKNARIKTGTRSKTGTASFRTGIFLIRVLISTNRGLDCLKPTPVQKIRAPWSESLYLNIE